MKIKLYIITYNRPKALNETLWKLFNTDAPMMCDITIINNHSNFVCDGGFGHIRVLHNQTRPDWSCGNLSENYNQCLLDGFRSLTNPDCDIVVHIQDDCMLHDNWVENLKRMHQDFTFVVGKYGDNIISYRPEAVKRIGMWDENFCGIQHKEADYFIRALICNKEESCINDILHNRQLNNDEALDLDIMKGRNFQVREGRLKRLQDDEEHARIKREAVRANMLLRVYFANKWFGTRKPEFDVNHAEGWLIDWTEDFVERPPALPGNLGVFMKYPWFEKDLDQELLNRYLIPIRKEWYSG